MHWELHQPEVRFDICAKRAEYEFIRQECFRMNLCDSGGEDRTKEIPIAEGERLYQIEAEARRLLHQGRCGGARRKEVMLRAKRILTNPCFANVI